MRKIINFIQLSFFFFIAFALGKTCFSQLTVEMGKDTTYCVGLHPDTMYLPQNITINGGTEPYTIAWECKVPKGLYEFYTASDFLNDTTILTPYFVNSHYPGKWIVLTLHVTDSENNYVKDSLRIRFSTFRYLLGYIVIEVEKGDSVLFNQSSVGGGIEPLRFHWQPTIGLTNPDTLVTWCKTDSLTQWRNEYYIVATDSCGCVSDPSLVYEIRVLPTGIDEQQDEWAPIGAKWYYTAPYFDPIFTNDGTSCIVMESIKDSSIAGLPVRVLELRRCLNDRYVARAYIRQNRDSIFYYHQKDEKFYLLYNFAAKIGDTITVHDSVFELPEAFLYRYNKTANAFKYRIVEIDSLNINGNWHKRQKVKAVSPSFWGFFDHMVNSYIIEKIGNTVFFFGRIAGTTPEETVGQLRCYSDEKTIYQSPDWPSNCDLVLSSKIMAHTDESIRLYPNPANDYLTIEPVAGMQSISIFSFDGRLIRFKEVHKSNGPVTLPVGHMQPGTYLVRMVTGEKVLSKTFIKNAK